MYAPTAVIAAVAPVRITVLRLRRVVIMSGGGRGLGCAKVSAGNKPGQVTCLAYKMKFLTKF